MRASSSDVPMESSASSVLTMMLVMKVCRKDQPSDSVSTSSPSVSGCLRSSTISLRISESRCARVLRLPALNVTDAQVGGVDTVTCPKRHVTQPLGMRGATGPDGADGAVADDVAQA